VDVDVDDVFKLFNGSYASGAAMLFDFDGGFDVDPGDVASCFGRDALIGDSAAIAGDARKAFAAIKAEAVAGSEV
jgi:hypothetical protein